MDDYDWNAGIENAINTINKLIEEVNAEPMSISVNWTQRVHQNILQKAIAKLEEQKINTD